MNLIGKYIKYKLISKGKHQIHSPFVFDFLTKCLRLKIQGQDKIKLNKLKLTLKNNPSLIEIQDFGAGSKKLNKIRSISQIYKNASSKGIYAELLYQLSKYYKIKNSLELGTSLGFGTLHLAFGNQENQITTVDACGNTQEIAKENIKHFELKNITFVKHDFQTFLSDMKVKYERPKFDLIFIDGHHNGEALKNYLELLEDFSHDETIFILDDIRWSKDMFQAWNEIISMKKYHLSLDLFRMGIVWKREHQAKEHFVIKLKGILRGML
ncbi:MAG: class I SAM-dependent methyltransferase [Bacteroidota bacterium]